MRALLPKKAELDKLAGAIIRARGHCEALAICKSINSTSIHAKRLSWAHVVSRRYLETRWDLDNAFCLCMACHMYYTYNPIQWEQFVINKIGKRKYDQLKKRAVSSTKVDYGQKKYLLNQAMKLIDK